MSILYPDFSMNRVTDITPELLDSRGITGLIIDIDNTLTHHNSPTIELNVLAWMNDMKSRYACILLSNNYEDRVRPFAEILEMDYISMGAKPLPKKGLTTAANRIGKKPEEIAMIGDQIFTDVLGGNLFGATSIRVDPIQTEGGWFFNVKRALENLVMKGYDKKRGMSK